MSESWRIGRLLVTYIGSVGLFIKPGVEYGPLRLLRAAFDHSVLLPLPKDSHSLEHLNIQFDPRRSRGS
jgi:hypothetical protein